jgi:hypothetical protein
LFIYGGDFLLGFCAMKSCRNWHFRGAYCRRHQGDECDKLIALTMEAVSISETLINFYEITWCNMPENSEVRTLLWEPETSPIYIYILVSLFSLLPVAWRFNCLACSRYCHWSLLHSLFQNLLKAFLQNLSSSSAVVRRTAAASIVTICLNCRKPHVFISYILNTLLGQLKTIVIAILHTLT